MQILISKFYIIECISRIIKVIDFKNARWKPEINTNIIFNNAHDSVLFTCFNLLW